MTVQQSELAEGRGQEWIDDEIDLRRYIAVIARWWREILLCTLLGAILGGAAVLALRQIGAPQYEAAANVVIARIVSEVTLDERFTTAAEAQQATSAASRRAALVALVESGAIAQAVIDELGAQLHEEERNPAALLEMIQGQAAPGPDARTPGDLITITATADDPEKAAAIANAWARNYVAQVNLIYGQVPSEAIASVEAERAEAFAKYEAVQADWEEFVATNRIAAIQRQIAAKTALLTSLQEGRQEAIEAVVRQDRDLRLALFENLSEAQTEAVAAVFDEQAQAQLRELNRLYLLRGLAERYLEQVRALADQVERGGDAAAESNSVAIQILKLQAFASLPVNTQPQVVAPDIPSVAPSSQPVAGQAPQPPVTQVVPLAILSGGQPQSSAVQINLQPGGTSAADQSADLAAFAAALEARLGQLDASIEALSSSLLAGDTYRFLDQLDPAGMAASAAVTTTEQTAQEAASGGGLLSEAIVRGYEGLLEVGELAQLVQADGRSDALAQAIDTIEQEVQQLEGQLEAENARRSQLTQARDLAWSAWTTLDNKVVELNLARTGANSEVRLGAPAVTPIVPIEGASTLLSAMLGAMAGLVLGLVLAFFLEFMGRRPFLLRGAPRESR